MANNYLLKRSPDLIDGLSFDYHMSKTWYADVKLNAMPDYSSRLLENDTIFIAESGYAIIGKGTLDRIELYEFNSIEKFIDFFLYDAKTRHERYWFMKLANYFKKRRDLKKICVREISIKDPLTFDVPHILAEEYLEQRSWYSLGKHFKLEDIPSINERLTKYIPTSIRRDLYHKYKIKSKSHIFDIDHHVPKSLGGPGNIEENLIPIGRSLNRLKSNSVPSKLFGYAKDFNIDIPPNTIFEHDRYYEDNKRKSIAKRIVHEINKDFEMARSIYSEIKLAHFPNLA